MEWRRIAALLWEDYTSTHGWRQLAYLRYEGFSFQGHRFTISAFIGEKSHKKRRYRTCRVFVVSPSINGTGSISGNTTTYDFWISSLINYIMSGSCFSHFMTDMLSNVAYATLAVDILTHPAC